MARILMIVSAADHVRLTDGTDHPTGFWAEEVAASHRVLAEAGHQVEIATPAGHRPTVDPISLDERGGVDPAEGAKFAEYLQGLDLSAPLKLSGVSADDYDAFYLPGGHGPMTDLVDDADLGTLLNDADARGKTIAALCHGLAALLSARGEDGSFTFAGRSMTSFSDEEERQGGLGDKSPFFVETRLREQGAIVTPAAAWSSEVVVDGNLVTGQNPQSSVATAERVLELLKAA
ncbi:Putative intracellular protease/amidase [Amycolatopsis lurida]|uniref:Thiamine biosynthesis protein ThiJ n=1 Tax=Amycolatopsis lurida NRRL 2430 TaxID=1460371 RepID=A0A2P2FRR7_AMYLU|nr:type 1 glutamine amidotransferase domain-containing protein [Amycolatopsis lurida]KFU79406.1 thiamine biosynthesis protein ThiJ [Amycolatopsis lurida NRRL 2430]SED11563.1 Putative intracellular protease/amidase [Amycolatopsis lurida]